ncbi:MAG: glutamine amidotransferase [Dehalococcoidia bacterium]
MSETRELRVGHLYGSLLNLYGDRGNILTLKYRCEQRGIGFVVEDIGLGKTFEPSGYDLLFVGGGPDREQQRVADDLVDLKAVPLREAADSGQVILAVCGGYQLLGHYYREAGGEELPGAGVLDLHTEHPGDQARRCIGNIIARWDEGMIVGFENHGGRTRLGPTAQPLATVEVGYGNNGEDDLEGARQGNVFGTYIHGSLLPKNPAFADYLIGLALSRRYGEEPLAPLDDSLELRARAVAEGIARREHRRKSA